VNTSWSILLIELIRAVNRYDGKAVTDQDVEDIQEATCKAVRKVYPLMGRKRLRMRRRRQGRLHDEGFLQHQLEVEPIARGAR